MRDCPVHGSRFIEPMELVKTDRATGRDLTVKNPNAGRCSACTDYNVNNYRAGRAKRQPLREQRMVPRGPIKSISGPGYIVTDPHKVDQRGIADFFDRLGEGMEVERASELAAASRRPTGVSSAAYGVAIRRASRTPMLNAEPKLVRDALEQGKRDYRMPKDGIATAWVVKPKAMINGKTQGWWERRWVVHKLKYSKGFCLVTDKGDESKAFRTIGELRSAVVKSGWEIVR